MKANRNATKAMSRIAVRFLGGALGVASLLPQHPRAHFAVEIVAKRSEEHTSELQSLMRISYAVFCLKKKQIVKPKQTKYNKLQSPIYASPSTTHKQNTHNSQH